MFALQNILISEKKIEMFSKFCGENHYVLVDLLFQSQHFDFVWWGGNSLKKHNKKDDIF